MNHKKKKHLIIWSSILGFLILLHIALPFILVKYVNKVLKDTEGYDGSVEWIHVNLFRGAYAIHDLKLMVEGGDPTEPLFQTKTIDISIEWGALLKGSIAGEIIIDQPELIFVSDTTANSDKAVSNPDADWTKTIKELLPIKINRFEITKGKVRFTDPSSNPKVDISIDSLYFLATNLSNAAAKDGTLPSSYEVSAISIGGGRLSASGGLNIIKKVPDFDLDLKFEGVDLTALNDFTEAYAKLTLERGTLDFYTELAGSDGQLEGYVKPLLKDLKFIDLDKEKSKPLQVIWEGIVSGVLEVFENQKKDQFGSKVPISGSYENTETKILPAVGSIIKNAFIQALNGSTDGSINFGEAGSKDKE